MLYSSAFCLAHATPCISITSQILEHVASQISRGLMSLTSPEAKWWPSLLHMGCWLVPAPGVRRLASLCSAAQQWLLLLLLQQCRVYLQVRHLVPLCELQLLLFVGPGWSYRQAACGGQTRRPRH
jgi:hypothetical protein